MFNRIIAVLLLFLMVINKVLYISCIIAFENAIMHDIFQLILHISL